MNCQVCRRPGVSSSPLFRCTRCSCQVHRQCYGVGPSVDSRQWRCDNCIAGTQHGIKCEICASTADAPFRLFAGNTEGSGESQQQETSTRARRRSSRISSGKQWVHALCAISHPLYELAPDFSGVIMREKDDQLVARKQLKMCQVCHSPCTWFFECSHPTCRFLAHPICALVAFPSIEWKFDHRHDETWFRGFCDLEAYHNVNHIPEKIKRAKTLSQRNIIPETNNESHFSDSESSSQSDSNESYPSSQSEVTSDYDDSESEAEQAESSAEFDSISKGCFVVSSSPGHSLFGKNSSCSWLAFKNIFSKSCTDDCLRRTEEAFKAYICKVELFIQKEVSLACNSLVSRVSSFLCPRPHGVQEFLLPTVVITGSIDDRISSTMIQSLVSHEQLAEKAIFCKIPVRNFANSSLKTPSLLKIVYRELLELPDLERFLADQKDFLSLRDFLCKLSFYLTQNSRRIIFIIDNLEYLNSIVLGDLCELVLSSLGSRLSAFIWFLSSSNEFLSSYISLKSSSELSIRSFQSEPSFSNVQFIIESLFKYRSGLEDPPCMLQLGPRPFRFLMDDFLCQSMSLDKFIKGIRLAFLVHSQEGLHDDLWLRIVDSNGTLQLDSIKDSKLIERLKQLPSFTGAKTTVNECLSMLYQVWKDWPLTFEYLYVTVQHLFGASSHSWMDIYCSFVSSSNSRNAFLEKIYSRISKLQELEIKSLLSLWLDFVEDHRGDLFTFEHESAVRELVSSITASMSDRLAAPMIFNSSEQNSFNTPLKSRTNKRSQFMRSIKKAKEEKEAPLKATQDRTVRFLQSVIAANLPAFDSIALHEIMYFDDPNDRISTYINCDVYRDIPNQLIGSPSSSNFSDSGKLIFQQIYLGEKVISLHDLYRQYRKCMRGAFEEDLLKAKFIQSIKDLQFAGLIKPYSRKPDHIQKLTLL